MTKICTTCLQEKALEEFFFYRRTKRLASFCKACKRQKDAAYYQANKTQLKALMKTYAQKHRQAMNAYKLAWWRKNIQRVNEIRRKSYAKHRAKQLASRQRYNEHNRQYIRARRQRWRQENPAREYLMKARRRARLLQAPINDLTTDQWQEIVKHYHSRCVYCGKKLNKLTMDHIIPLSKGGANTASNVVPACRSCNSKKSSGAPLKPVQPLLLTASKSKDKR